VILRIRRMKNPRIQFSALGNKLKKGQLSQLAGCRWVAHSTWSPLNRMGPIPFSRATNFINSLNCTGTWVASGNALTLTNDCGRGQSQDNIHYSLSDTIMTWVYDFSETGKRFKMTTLESSF